jgi:thiol-disulfide isomerase/thioredoxin
MIFMDCYASWCAPCAAMADKVFPDSAVGSWFNTRCICVKMNMETEEGRPLRKQFAVGPYPTLLLLNADGYKVSQKVGFQQADSLLGWAKSNAGLEDSVTWQQRFDRGERSEVLLRQYFTWLVSGGQTEKARADLEALLEVDSGSFSESRYWQLLGVAAVGQPAAEYLVAHAGDLARRYGRPLVEAQLWDIYTAPDQLARLFYPLPVRKVRATVYDSLRSTILRQPMPGRDFLLSALEFYVDARSGATEAAFNVATEALSGGDAWRFYELAKLSDWTISRPEDRARAAAWAMQAAMHTDRPGLKQACRQLEDRLKRGRIQPDWMFRQQTVGLDL